jgi:hypothetical protein
VSLEPKMQHSENNQNTDESDRGFTGENNSGNTAELRPGEKGFTIFLLILSAFFLYQSILLYRKNPGSSSCAALPLGVSILLTVLSLWNVILNIKKKTPLSGSMTIAKKVRDALVYIFPMDVLVMTGLVVLYCAALRMGLGFYISTPIFLWCSMCYLLRKDYLINLLWTTLCMLFILLVFSLLFSVVLP